MKLESNTLLTPTANTWNVCMQMQILISFPFFLNVTVEKYLFVEKEISFEGKAFRYSKMIFQWNWIRDDFLDKIIIMKYSAAKYMFETRKSLKCCCTKTMIKLILNKIQFCLCNTKFRKRLLHENVWMHEWINNNAQLNKYG